MTDPSMLDTSRRYLVPVARLNLPDEPDLVHLSLYQWLEREEAWATGRALCGYSTTQGALPDGTEVTCPECLEHRPDYERYLAPGYDPADDDPKALRAKLAKADRLWREREVENGALFDKLMAAENERDRLLAEVAAARKFAAEMRDFCSPHGVATDYADRLIESMDRAREAGR